MAKSILLSNFGMVGRCEHVPVSYHQFSTRYLNRMTGESMLLCRVSSEGGFDDWIKRWEELAAGRPALSADIKWNGRPVMTTARSFCIEDFAQRIERHRKISGSRALGSSRWALNKNLHPQRLISRIERRERKQKATVGVCV